MPARRRRIERDWILAKGDDLSSTREPFEKQDAEEADFEAARALYSDIEQVLAKHLKQSEQMDLWRLADFILRRRASLGALQDFWSKKEVTDDLLRFRRNLVENHRIFEDLPWPVRKALALNGIKDLLGKPVPSTSWNEGFPKKFLVEAHLNESIEYRAYQAFLAFDRQFRHLLPGVDAAIETAKMGVPVGKKSIEAWRTVQACVDLLTDVMPGIIDIPAKRMGPSGPFYRFISDIFLVLEHEEDPESAVSGWRRHVDSNGPKKS